MPLMYNRLRNETGKGPYEWGQILSTKIFENREDVSEFLIQKGVNIELHGFMFWALHSRIKYTHPPLENNPFLQYNSGEIIRKQFLTSDEKKDFDTFMAKFGKGRVVYFMNTFENAVIKCTARNDYMLRVKGDLSNGPTDNTESIIYDALLEHKEITRKDYNNFWKETSFKKDTIEINEALSSRLEKTKSPVTKPLDEDQSINLDNTTNEEQKSLNEILASIKPDLIRTNLILAKIGLLERLTDKASEDFIDNNYLFIQYCMSDYLNSKTCEDDEIYRMTEFVLLHRKSGMRMEYLMTEDWYGLTSTFQLRDNGIFIVTFQHPIVRIEVSDIDILKQHFIAGKKVIPFSAVMKDKIKDSLVIQLINQEFESTEEIGSQIEIDIVSNELKESRSAKKVSLQANQTVEKMTDKEQALTSAEIYEMVLQSREVQLQGIDYNAPEYVRKWKDGRIIRPTTKEVTFMMKVNK